MSKEPTKTGASEAVGRQGAPVPPEQVFPWRRALLVAAAMGALWLALNALQNVLTPIVLAVALAYVFDPVVDRFEARGWSRTRAIALLLLIFFGVLTLSLLIAVPLLQAEIGEVASRLPMYQASVREAFNTHIAPPLNRYGFPTSDAPEAWWADLSLQMQNLAPSLASVFASVWRGLAGNILNVFLLIVNTLLVPVFTFYFLRDWDRLVSATADLVPRRYQSQVNAQFREVDAVLGAFIRGQLTVCGVLAVLYSAGLLALQVPLGLVIGVLAGAAFLIPYLGTAVGIVLASVLTLLHFGLAAPEWIGIPRLVLVLGWFGLVQAVESWAITPKLVGGSVGLHPVVVIVAIIVGGQLLGFLGVLLAVPTTAASAVFLKALILKYRASGVYLRG